MGQRKFKIAYFQQDGLITGSAISLRHFLSAINREQYEPVVILAAEGPARGLYEALNIPVYVFSFATFWTFPGPKCLSRGMIRQLKALLPDKKLRDYILKTIKPDLVHINDKASLNIGVSLQGTHIPLIQHSRSSYRITSCKAGAHLSSTAIKKYASHIISISADESDTFNQLKNHSIIYNTVDETQAAEARARRAYTRQSMGITDNQFVIGFAAAITEKKGAWDFLSMCKSLAGIEKLHFLMVGKVADGDVTDLGNGIQVHKSPQKYIDDFILEHKLENRLTLTGFSNNSLNLIAAMDLLIVPNKNGVLGRQPLEAQSVGTPVIAYKGLGDEHGIIKHGETGYMVSSVNESIDLVKQLMNSNRTDMSVKALEHANKHFKPANNMKIIEAIYARYLQQ